MHIGSAILILWLVIGGFAAGQRGDYKEAFTCSGAATAAATILAGPSITRAWTRTSIAPRHTPVISDRKESPRINCAAPRPSRLMSLCTCS